MLIQGKLGLGVCCIVDSLRYKHSQHFISRPNSNGCQFFITCKKAEWLDGKHVVFGQVLGDESMMTVRKCEAVPTKGNANQPRYPIRIVQCGEL